MSPLSSRVWWSGSRSSAGASPLWSTMPTPGLGVSGGVLNGVSCPSATSASPSAPRRAANGDRAQLVVRWDGTTWSKMPTTDRAGVLESSLKGVSCPSATFCFAVGEETSKRVSGRSLIEEWNGQTWSQSASAAPYVNYLSGGVSCASPSACFLVGGEDAAHTSVLQYWNGVEWSVMPDPNRAARPWGRCRVRARRTASRSARSAVPHGVANTVAEHWDGSSWSVIPSGIPGGFFDVNMTGVSCPSPSSCIAVGYGGGGGKFPPLAPVAEQWDGSRWSQIVSPAVGPQSFLNGVSCAGPGSCVAVGADGIVGLGVSDLRGSLASWDGDSVVDRHRPEPGRRNFSAECGVVSERGGLLRSRRVHDPGQAESRARSSAARAA